MPATPKSCPALALLRCGRIAHAEDAREVDLVRRGLRRPDALLDMLEVLQHQALGAPRFAGLDGLDDVLVLVLGAGAAGSGAAAPRAPACGSHGTPVPGVLRSAWCPAATGAR